MAAESTTNGVLLDELHYEPIPDEPADLFKESHADDLPVKYETPAPEPAPEPAPAKPPRTNQIEAMRQALADLGLGAKNADLAEYLRTKFDLQPKNIALLKSQAKKSLFKKQGEGTKAPSSAKVPETDPPEAVEAHSPTDEEKPKKKANLAPKTAINGASNGHRTVLIRHRKQPDGAVVSKQLPLATIYLVEEVQAVKTLCNRMGAENLLKLLDILGV